MVLLIRAAIEDAKMSFTVFRILGPMPSSPVAFALFNPLINPDTCAMDINGISKRMSYGILSLINSFNFVNSGLVGISSLS